MAVTSTIQYCTERQLKDVYPGLSSYDTKQRIYGFTEVEDNYTHTNSVDTWICNNTGLVTALYRDSNNLISGSQTLESTLTAQNETGGGSFTADSSDTALTVTDGTKVDAKSYIRMNDEILYIQSLASTNVLTVVRGRLGTVASTHLQSTSVIKHFFPESNGDWKYDDDNDFLILAVTNGDNPNNNIYEAGEDWSTLKTRTIRRASRMVESLLDSRLSREINKDREGNYPEFIIRATALKSIVLLLRAHDPENSIIESFEEEFKEIIDGYRSGMITLPNSITMDSSKGIIREVSVASTADLFPVELKGYYNGVGYELLKIAIATSEGGVIGIARMTVLGKSSTSLKAETIIDSETITGDFQSLGVGSLKVRWSGDDIATALCVQGDEYEIELHGSGLDATISKQGSVRLSRRYG